MILLYKELFLVVGSLCSLNCTATTMNFAHFVSARANPNHSKTLGKRESESNVVCIISLVKSNSLLHPKPYDQACILSSSVWYKNNVNLILLSKHCSKTSVCSFDILQLFRLCLHQKLRRTFSTRFFLFLQIYLSFTFTFFFRNSK